MITQDAWPRSRPIAKAGVEPSRIACFAGRQIRLFEPPGGCSDKRLWVESEALFDIIGLAPTARADFAERNGCNLPGNCNIVRTPAGRVGTYSPEIAAVCIGIAERAGAITREAATGLRLSTGLDAS